MDNLSGQTIKGYELHDLIGAGGFGAVYRASQPLLRRDVAMKIILPEYANHPEFIRRFEFEAQLVARLEHIHIVALYDYWREPDGAYLIMRWLRGGSLRTLLKEGPVSNELAVHITEQIGSALTLAHRRGVVHRDIKPDNILFDEEQNAYLADFGIAKDLRETTLAPDGREGEESDMGESALTGSPFYLSPEQAQAAEVTPQSDLYSLGIVMYEMLVGQPPFFGEDKGLMEILLSHINDPLPSLQEMRTDLPPEVDVVIQRATNKDPLSRYKDAISLAVDFRRALTGTDQEVMPSEARPREGGAVLDDVLVITKPISPSTLIIVPTEAVANPYKGLQPFEEADAEDFFGRDELIEKLLARLKEPGDISRFLAVIGPSGSGKSSVVKAGLIPALRKGALPNSERWYMVEMVPGGDPFRELASALLGIAVDPPEGLLERLRTDEMALVDAIEEIIPSGEESGLVLTIDQFEEVFTLVDDNAGRTHFLDLLLRAIAEPSCRMRLIITLRADFYDRPLLYPGFGEMVRRRNEVVLPLSTDEMREAIVAPAERVGMTVETGLVAAIVAEIGEQPGALPLLQYALTEVFERREGNALTLKAYEASGGVLGALARRAEELYQQTEASGQEAMHQVFLRLVNLGEGAEDTRRRVEQGELMGLVEDADLVNEVIQALGRYRLLTFDHDPETRAPTVAVAHEALIREWQRLREWLDDSREDILLQRRLAAATVEWRKLDRDASFLASGMRLAQFEALVDGATIALTPDEIYYVKASVARREAIEAEEAARLAREEALEKRARNRLRTIAVGSAVGAVIMTVLAVLAFMSFQEAEDERQNADNQRVTAEFNFEVAEEQRGIAERNLQISDSLALVANAQKELISNNTDLAVALSIKANEIPDPPIEAQLMLAEAAFSPGARRIMPDHDTFVFGAAFSPDGKQAISGAYDQLLFLWDLETGEVIRQFEGHESFIRGVDFSPDGQTVLSGAMDMKVILWDVATGEPIHVMEGHESPVRAVRYSPDGTQALSGSDDFTVILWDLETGEMIYRLEGHEERVRGVDFSPDGKLAASASYDSTVKLWDLETGEEIRTLVGHDDKVANVKFSLDGQTLLSGGADRTIRLWDVATGEEIQRFQGHGTWVKSMDFHPDGRHILSSSDDSTIRLWDLETGDEVRRFTGHADFVDTAQFSPDGSQVLSSSGDGTVRLWDLYNGAEVKRFLGHQAGVFPIAITPDGQTAVTGGFDGVAYVWDIASGERIGEFYGTEGWVQTVIFGPETDDGGLTAISSDTGSNDIFWWDVATGEVIQTYTGHEDWVNVVALAPDGTLFSGSKDTLIIQWNLETGEEIQRLDAHTDELVANFIGSIAFSPDGAWMATTAELGDIFLWDVSTWEVVRRFENGHSELSAVNYVEFSPDGSQIVTASNDTEAIVWDVASAEIVYRVQGHTAPLLRALFSPDGSTLATSSYDGTIRLWDAATGVQTRQLNNEGAVWGLAYSPDGQTVLSGSEDTTVRLWDATPLSLSRLLEWTYGNRYVPELTCRQREQFRTEPRCDEAGVAPTSTPYAP